MASTPQNWSSLSRQSHDERSPNTTSQPIQVHDDRIPKPMPVILLNKDTTPGTVHHGHANITDYTCWHYPSRITRDEEKIASRRAPPCWVDRVGTAPPPGFELEPVKRKEVVVVPVMVSPWDNRREISRLKWVDEERRRREKGVDEGYASAGEDEVEGVCVDKEGGEGGFSVWSC